MKCFQQQAQSPLRLSPPAWGRGLKSSSPAHCAKVNMSPPAWGRGLKFLHVKSYVASSASPPAWGRGLKYHLFKCFPCVPLGRPLRGGVG